MRTLFGVAVLLLVVIAGVGFYQGWFHFSTTSTDQGASATFSVDQNKIHEDEQKARDKMHGLGQEAKELTGDKAENGDRADAGDQADAVEEPESQP